MNELQVALMLLGQATVDAYKNSLSMNLLADKHNQLLRDNRVLMEENELANKDAAQLRMKIDRMLENLETLDAR